MSCHVGTPTITEQAIAALMRENACSAGEATRNLRASAQALHVTEQELAATIVALASL